VAGIDLAPIGRELSSGYLGPDLRGTYWFPADGEGGLLVRAAGLLVVPTAYFEVGRTLHTVSPGPVGIEVAGAMAARLDIATRTTNASQRPDIMSTATDGTPEDIGALRHAYGMPRRRSWDAVVAAMSDPLDAHRLRLLPGVEAVDGDAVRFSDGTSLTRLHGADSIRIDLAQGRSAEGPAQPVVVRTAVAALSARAALLTAGLLAEPDELERCDGLVQRLLRPGRGGVVGRARELADFISPGTLVTRDAGWMAENPAEAAPALLVTASLRAVAEAHTYRSRPNELDFESHPGPFVLSIICGRWAGSGSERAWRMPPATPIAQLNLTPWPDGIGVGWLAGVAGEFGIRQVAMTWATACTTASIFTAAGAVPRLDGSRQVFEAVTALARDAQRGVPVGERYEALVAPLRGNRAPSPIGDHRLLMQQIR
jgi:hypothetical protein